MWLPVIGVILGIILGMVFPFNLGDNINIVFAVVFVLGLNACFEGIKLYLDNSFKTKLFTLNFVINTVLGVLLSLLGTHLNVPLYLGVIFVFIYKLFKNIENILLLINLNETRK